MQISIYSHIFPSIFFHSHKSSKGISEKENSLPVSEVNIEASFKKLATQLTGQWMDRKKLNLSEEELQEEAKTLLEETSKANLTADTLMSITRAVMITTETPDTAQGFFSVAEKFSPENRKKIFDFILVTLTSGHYIKTLQSSEKLEQHSKSYETVAYYFDILRQILLANLHTSHSIDTDKISKLGEILNTMQQYLVNAPQQAQLTELQQLIEAAQELAQQGINEENAQELHNRMKEITAMLVKMSKDRILDRKLAFAAGGVLNGLHQYLVNAPQQAQMAKLKDLIEAAQELAQQGINEENAQELHNRMKEITAMLVEMSKDRILDRKLAFAAGGVLNGLHQYMVNAPQQAQLTELQQLIEAAQELAQQGINEENAQELHNRMKKITAMLVEMSKNGVLDRKLAFAAGGVLNGLHQYMVNAPQQAQLTELQQLIEAAQELAQQGINEENAQELHNRMKEITAMLVEMSKNGVLDRKLSFTAGGVLNGLHQYLVNAPQQAQLTELQQLIEAAQKLTEQGINEENAQELHNRMKEITAMLVKMAKNGVLPNGELAFTAGGVLNYLHNFITAKNDIEEQKDIQSDPKEEEPVIEEVAKPSEEIVDNQEKQLVAEDEEAKTREEQQEKTSEEKEMITTLTTRFFALLEKTRDKVNNGEIDWNTMSSVGELKYLLISLTRQKYNSDELERAAIEVIKLSEKVNTIYQFYLTLDATITICDKGINADNSSTVLENTFSLYTMIEKDSSLKNNSASAKIEGIKEAISNFYETTMQPTWCSKIATPPTAAHHSEAIAVC